MSLESSFSSGESTQGAEALIMREKHEASEASTVGEMRENFVFRIGHLLQHFQTVLPQNHHRNNGDEFGIQGDDGAYENFLPLHVLERVASQHVDEMDRATVGKESISLMGNRGNILGQNVVGGGDGTMQLSASLFIGLDGTGKHIERIQHTVAHESAHGRQVSGAPLKLLEGHAEIVAGEETGHGAHYRRTGQPDAFYGEGQSLALHVSSIIGRDTFENAMTQDFFLAIRALLQSHDPQSKHVLREIAMLN